MNSNSTDVFSLSLVDVSEVVEDEQVAVLQTANSCFERQFAPCNLQSLHKIGGARKEPTATMQFLPQFRR